MLPPLRGLFTGKRLGMEQHRIVACRLRLVHQFERFRPLAARAAGRPNGGIRVPFCGTARPRSREVAVEQIDNGAGTTRRKRRLTAINSSRDVACMAIKDISIAVNVVNETPELFYPPLDATTNCTNHNSKIRAMGRFFQYQLLNDGGTEGAHRSYTEQSARTPEHP
jgi:hypothetical protein